ncbi:MAG: hypothetical protein D6776_06615 [Planctomycetota bacterium]|nr:MAG: hypothetical protein D6776_06615 [Planctomycetota bacterium]
MRTRPVTGTWPKRFAAAMAVASLAAAPLLAAPQPADDAPDAAERQRRADEERRRAAAEEMFLRMQIEAQLNELARWNPDRQRIELRERNEDDPASTALEALLELVADPAGGERLRFRSDLKIRPFVLAFQKFMASGGARDLERLQQGDNPYENGLAPHAEQLLTDLVEALNAQDDPADEQERQREQQRRTLYAKIERVLREGLDLPEREVERHLRLVRALDRRLQRELRNDRWRERLREIARSRRTAALLERLREEALRLSDRPDLPPWVERVRRALEREQQPPPAPRRPTERERADTPAPREDAPPEVY